MLENPVSAIELIKLIQAKIADGTIDPNKPIAVCANYHPRNEYWTLSKKDLGMETYQDKDLGELSLLLY
jgi:hypothetical protein